MKRSALRRYTALKRGPAPRRKVAPRRRNPERSARRFAAAYLTPGYAAWVKTLACSVPGCTRTNIECAHVDKPRSRGGRWDEIAPLCHAHHVQQEKRTPQFNAEHGIDLFGIADAVALRWKAFAKEQK